MAKAPPAAVRPAGVPPPPSPIAPGGPGAAPLGVLLTALAIGVPIYVIKGLIGA